MADYKGVPLPENGGDKGVWGERLNTETFPAIIDQLGQVGDQAVAEHVLGASLTGAAIDQRVGGRPIRPVVDVTSLPLQVNAQRRYIQSAYSQDSVTTWGGHEVVIAVGHDLHGWVCKRRTGAKAWDQSVDLTTLPGNPFGPQVDDSHATWTIAVDVNGRLLVTGNVHGTPAITAVSGPDLDLDAWTMIVPSANQQMVTYDKWVILDDGAILRFWREGYATGGSEWMARWDPDTLAFVDERELLDGGASGEGPYTWRIATRGQKLAVFYCWRGEGDASTNSDLCYVESLDGGVTWQTIAGVQKTLPIARADSDVIRAIPAGSGLINQGGSDIDIDGLPHVAYLIEVDDATQIVHTWHDGTSWQSQQLTDYTRLIPTVGATTLNLIHSRPQLICTDAGQTLVIARSDEGPQPGAPFAIDASPGADRTPFLLAAMHLYHWEPAIDSRALREHGQLKMLLAPTDPNKDSKQGFVRQWAGVLTIDLAQVEQVRARRARIPTIRTWSIYEWGPEFIAGTTSESNFVGKTVYVASSSGGAADMALQIGPGVPQIAQRSIGPGMEFFVRQSVRIALQNGATNGDIKLRETRSAGSLPEHDVAHIAIANSSYAGVQDVPWCPLPGTPYIEESGTPRDTRLVPRLRSSAADGLRLGAWSIEIGILDYT